MVLRAVALPFVFSLRICGASSRQHAISRYRRSHGVGPSHAPRAITQIWVCLVMCYLCRERAFSFLTFIFLYIRLALLVLRVSDARKTSVGRWKISLFIWFTRYLSVVNRDLSEIFPDVNLIGRGVETSYSSSWVIEFGAQQHGCKQCIGSVVLPYTCCTALAAANTGVKRSLFHRLLLLLCW